MTLQRSELSQMLFDLRGIAMRIQNKFRAGHEEAVYHRLLLAALQKAGFSVETKPRLEVRNAYQAVVKQYYPDLRVSRNHLTGLIEVKADPDGLKPAYIRQAQAYLSVDPKSRFVLLINFAGKRLESKALFRKDL